MASITINTQYVIFVVGKEHYGLGIEAVHEIVRVPEITAVPDAPEFLEGVINLRGRIVPVVDLRKRFGLPPKERTKSTRVLITENRDKQVGLLVDSVAEVRKIFADTIDEPPEMVSAVGVEYITGVAKSREALVVLLDLAKILDVEDMKRIVSVAEDMPATTTA